MIEVVQKEGVVSLGLRRDAVGKSRIRLFVLRVPALGVRRVGDHRINKEGGVRLVLVLLGVEPGPVVLERVAVASDDVGRQDATHHEVHAGEVIGVLLELLSVVLDGVWIAIASSDRLADVDEQRARATRGVVDLDFFAAIEVPGDNLTHELGNLVRGIELARLLACVGREVGDEVLVDKAKDVVVLAAIHGDVLDKLRQVTDSLGLTLRIAAELGEARLQSVENAVKHAALRLANIAVKG